MKAPLAILTYGKGLTRLSSVETNGRFQQDTTPTYGLPYNILASHSKLNLQKTDIPRLLVYEDPESVENSHTVKYFCACLKQLNKIIKEEEESSNREIWSDPLFRVYHLSPLLHVFLSVPRATQHDSIHLRRRECFRLASILYLCNIWAKFDFDPGMGMLYGTKLRLMLSSQDMLPIWTESKVLLLWILCVAACSATLFDDLRNDCVKLLNVSLEAAGIQSFPQLLTIVDDFLESPFALGAELRALEASIAFEI